MRGREAAVERQVVDSGDARVEVRRTAAGPPTTPLLRVPVVLSADAVTVGASSPGPS